MAERATSNNTRLTNVFNAGSISVKKLRIENSVIGELNIVTSPSVGEPDEHKRVLRETDCDAINSSCKEFLKNQDWCQLSDTIFMHKTPLRPNREVYNAKQVHAADRVHDVVVKLIHTSDEHMRELDCLLKLTGHQNIVKILSSGYCTGVVPRIYIVMEQCHQNLNEYINENKFQLQAAKWFFEQLVSAIVFIHHNDIAHRDLKPSNILIAVDGITLKVSDFGVSKELPGGLTKVTVTHPQAGTDGFKAPETYLSAKLGYKADIFPLAINGYYIFAHGEHPYGSNEYRQPVNIMENEEPNLSKLPDFPEANKKIQLTGLLTRMLAHDPDKRPTAEQVQRDVFFTCKEADAADIPASTEEIYARSNSILLDEDAKEIPSMQFAKSSNVVDVSGILQKYDAIIKPPEAKHLSDSLAFATQMLREGKSPEAVSTVKQSIPEDLSALDVKDLAFMLKQEGHYIYSILMYRVSNELYKICNTTSTDDMKWFKELTTCIRCSVAPLIVEGPGIARDIAVSHGIKFMSDLLHDVRELENVNEDSRVLTEASCIVSISRISSDGKRYQYSIDVSKTGLTSLTERFGLKAKQYKYHGQLLNNVGEAVMQLGDYLVAENYLKKALDSKKSARYASRMMKRRDLKFTLNNLDKCQEKLGRSHADT